MAPVSKPLVTGKPKNAVLTGRVGWEGERSIERHEMSYKYECSQHEVTYWI